MTAEEYRTLREAVGSQKKVAEALGVDFRTIQRRESGQRAVNGEAGLAIAYLVKLVPVRGRLVGRRGNPKWRTKEE